MCGASIRRPARFKHLQSTLVDVLEGVCVLSVHQVDSDIPDAAQKRAVASKALRER